MKNQSWAFVLGALLAGPVVAGPADYVYTPIVEYGEREIDFKFGSAKSDGSSKQVSNLGFGYGATEYWFTEIYVKREREGDARLTLVEWENKFQLTETGKYPVDMGMIVELESPVNNGAEPYEFKFGPLLQKEFGKVQLNTNLLLERKFGTGGPHITELGYQLQAKYRWQPSFEFGMQALGEVGEWNDWDDGDNQNHRIGPAVFGKFDLGNRHKIKYNAAWLVGSTPAAPDHTFRMQAEYEF
ncbi:MAG: hypothetical protein Q7S51_03555 [Gallionellaceae bacterium]|nr:hypothetical protein [Gallionellaceae bacterium]